MIDRAVERCIWNMSIGYSRSHGTSQVRLSGSRFRCDHLVYLVHRSRPPNVSEIACIMYLFSENALKCSPENSRRAALRNRGPGIVNVAESAGDVTSST